MTAAVTIRRPRGPRVVEAELPAEVRRHVAWLRTRGLSEATVEIRLGVIRQLAKHVAPRPLLSITAADLADWQAELGDRLSRSAEATYVAQAVQWVRWAAKHEGTDPQLVDALIVPKLPRALPRPISEGDLRRAIDTAPVRVRPWLVLAGYGGLRAAEIAGLRAEDVHLDTDPPYLVVQGKGSKERVIPLGETAVRALREHGVPARGPVFRREDGRPGPNRPNMVTILAGTHLAAAGIPATLHQLRHRFATQVYRSTSDLLLTADLLGHSSVQTTRRYAAADPSKGIAAVRALDLVTNGASA